MKRIIKLSLLLLPLLIVSCSENESQSSADSSSSYSSSEIVSSSFSSSEELSSEELSSDYVSSEEESSSNLSESVSAPTTLELLAGYLANSRPTKAECRQKYNDPTIGVDLEHTSTLLVEYSSNPNQNKMKYTYTTQYLNPIGSDSMVGEKSGTLYAVGRDVYRLKGGKYSIEDDIETTSLSISLNLSDPDSIKINDIEDDYLSFSVDDKEIETVLGNNYDISNLSIELDFYDQQVYRMKVRYKLESNISVTVTTDYSYDEVSVVVPR